MTKQRIDPILEQTFALLLVGAVGALIGIFIYKTVTTEKYEYTDQQLEVKIQQTDRH